MVRGEFVAKYKLETQQVAKISDPLKDMALREKLLFMLFIIVIEIAN